MNYKRQISTQARIPPRTHTHTHGAYEGCTRRSGRPPGGWPGPPIRCRADSEAAPGLPTALRCSGRNWTRKEGKGQTERRINTELTHLWSWRSQTPQVARQRFSIKPQGTDNQRPICSAKVTNQINEHRTIILILPLLQPRTQARTNRMGVHLTNPRSAG